MVNNSIGRIASVDSNRIEIELDPESSGFVKAGSYGVLNVGAINSYVTVPAGTQRVVALVTAIRVREDIPRGAGQYSANAIASRTLSASIIGRVDSSSFRPGVAAYPPLNAPVFPATALDVAKIFSPMEGPSFALGEAVVSPGQDVLLDADVLLAKHCAVLGSTGSGKSYTVTGLLDGLLSLDIPQASILILDANGEYASAFKGDSPRGKMTNAQVLSLRDADDTTPFVLPHWFMNNSEHLLFLRASEGAQAPLLQRAIADARLGDDNEHAFVNSLLMLNRHLDSIEALLGLTSGKPQEVVLNSLRSLKNDVDARIAQFAGEEHEETFWREIVERVEPLLTIGLRAGVWAEPVTLNQKTGISDNFAEIRGRVAAALEQYGLGALSATSDFDAPRYYSFRNLYERYLPERIAIESAVEPRIKGFAATLQMRLSRIVSDSRFAFFAGVERYDDALGAYLRLLLGYKSQDLSSNVVPPWFRNQASDEVHPHQVTIIDLSSVASELVETVAGLIGRLVLELAQRMEPRAAVPVLLVLEEAHRYIPTSDHPSLLQGSAVFERIAKEGRKFGVSLILASQRPSELSRTVLAQCGTIIAHRIVNPDDQALIRSATSYAGRDVLEQLPGLAQQHAIVVGEAVPAATYVRIRDVINGPRSINPPFIAAWRHSDPAIALERITKAARAWEAGTIAGAPNSDEIEIDDGNG
jgi:DNA helicase HerA-like ATPase